jgi:hypothetical protein
MALAGFDIHDIANGNFGLFSVRGGKSFAGRDDENLISVVDVPAGRRADAEIDHVAAKVVRLPVADDRRPRNRSAATR